MMDMLDLVNVSAIEGEWSCEAQFVNVAAFEGGGDSW